MQQEAEGEPKKMIPSDKYYEYEELHSKPFITPESGISKKLLHLHHSFGYDSRHRANLKLLDDRTLIFIAGNHLILLDVSTKEQRYLRSCSGGGIGAIAVEPSRERFVLAEKGKKPNIIVYEYPSLRPYRILRGGTEREYTCVTFNPDGSLLASVGGDPDYTLTLWNWRQEDVMLRCKAASQQVYRVSFSLFEPGLVSSGAGHIKFWKLATSVTGLKLQGAMGHFGKTATTDIEGYMELPDGKVLSGTEWGNLLLWDRNTIQVEISRHKGQNCHAGTVQPFTVDDGQLMTFGVDGFIRGWDLESILKSSINGDSSRFEMEPSHEMLVGDYVCLLSVLGSPSDSFLWFAQDSNGAIWKLDLSFTNTAADPECLFSFHAGPIRGLDVSKNSHLMATTALDRSVRVFDFLAKREVTSSRFNQGGTALSWAPSSSGGLLVTGFEDGVVRLLELYNPQRWSPETEAKLRLQQVLKPHNAPVTAVAFDGTGAILATGSSCCSVFFFMVGEKYSPIGFIQVPGPVQALEWSPHSHTENKLLVLCQSGHVMEVPIPDQKAKASAKTYQLSELPRRSFRFRSIKSRIKREEEIRRRQQVAKKKREGTEKLRKLMDGGAELHEDEEEELPPLWIPDPPSPLCCGFYSQPGQFWLSMGGFDAGFLYHCKFSENQDEDPLQRQDEPFDFLSITDADDDPICVVTFSSNRQLLFCGMNSGSIRVYSLQAGDHSLTSMQAYWALNVHDNQYGHLQHTCCSHDDLFVLTAGDDGNIFSFCLLPPEKLQNNLQRQKAKIPSPRVGLENEALAQDIEDPAAYSIEAAKQKQEEDLLRQKAGLKNAEAHRLFAELVKKFKQVLRDNQKLPEHIRLTPEELQVLPPSLVEKMKAKKAMEVRKQMAWEQERATIALRKLQQLKDSMGPDIITVVCNGRRVSTYHLSSLSESLPPVTTQINPLPDEEAAAETDPKKPRAEPVKDSSQATLTPLMPPPEDKVFRPPVAQEVRIKLGARQEEKLRKAAEKAEQARAKIEKRKQKWAELYARKPKKDYQDLELLQAIREAKENIGDVIKKKEVTLNAEKKKEELISAEQKIHEQQTEMNMKIVALRDSKVQLVSHLAAQAQQLQQIHQRLAPDLRLPPPTLPTMLPEETPEKKLLCSPTKLERYKRLMEQRSKMNVEEEEGAVSLLDLLEKEMEAEKQKKEEEKTELVSSVTRDDGETEEELSELEKELLKEEELRLLDKQNRLLEQMKNSIRQFETEFLQLHRQKLRLDCRLKLQSLGLLTMFQETLLLRQFEERDNLLQEELRRSLQNEKDVVSKLEECKELLELKTGEITKLEEQERTLTAIFHASLGENNPYEEFLTKVFKKQIRRGKKARKGSEENDSEEDSDDESSPDDSDSDADQAAAALDVCPEGCDPELFENTLQLRDCCLDLKELLVDDKKVLHALKRDNDALIRKEELVKSSREAAERDLESFNQEKLQKINDLEVVIPLKLDQTEFNTADQIPSDLSEMVVLEKTELNRLKTRIQQLKVEVLEQEERHSQAKLKRSSLIRRNKEMAAEVRELEKQTDALMMEKFGQLVDLDALQTLPGSRRLEELKQEKLLLERAHAKETRLWKARLEKAKDALTEATVRHNECLRKRINMMEQRAKQEAEMRDHQKRTEKEQLRSQRRLMDQKKMQDLQKLIKKQREEKEILTREIKELSRKGGHVLVPAYTVLPPISPVPHPPSGAPSVRRKVTSKH